MNALERLVEGLLRDGHYRNATAIAAAIQMSLSAFQRGCQNGTLGIEKLLHLADHAGLDPPTVLRAARKPQAAAVLERLYHRAAPLTAADRVLLALPPDVKHRLVELTRALEQDPR